MGKTYDEGRADGFRLAYDAVMADFAAIEAEAKEKGVKVKLDYEAGFASARDAMSEAYRASGLPKRTE